MKKTLVWLFIALLGGVGLSPTLNAQVLYGSLVGTVTDQSGGIVPQATLTLTNVATGQVREATTDAEGRYSFQNVQAGTYELKASATGFRTITRTNVGITINTVARIPIELELGQVAEQVTVEGGAVLLQTDKADVHVELGKSKSGICLCRATEIIRV